MSLNKTWEFESPPRHHLLMKIKFLGTSAGWPLPRLGCKCKLCLSKDPKDKRTRSQLLINGSILLDAGPDTYSHFVNNKPNEIRHVLISHTHPDHIMGLWDLSHVYSRKWRINLVVPFEILKGLRKIPNFLLIQFKTNVVKSHENVSLGEGTTAEYFPVEHGKNPAFGIKIKERGSLVYIPDMSRIPKNELKKAKDASTLVMDGSSLTKHGQARTHQSIEEGVALAKNLKPKQAYFIHIGHATGTHKKLEDFVQKNGGKNFHISYDGLEINV